MAIQIQFRRGTAAEWTSVDPILAEAEMGIELDTGLFKIGTGLDPWNQLSYGGLRGFTGSVGFAGSIGNISVENVLYVSKSGDDANSGTSLNLSKLTIKSALSIAAKGTTIFVKSGDYTENNPLRVPEGVSVVGDNLRTVTVRPQNKTLDLFWVNNAVYLEQMTFKDHESPAAAVAFPTDGSVGVIHTSPYVQNCTSMTTTGTGMRVDGAQVEGLKSMVVDAFTQYNQGGIGIHHLNRGNSQLVSVFTICCDIGFLCESGGFCSVTNSNSSFGNYALKADGVSSSLYSAKVKGNQTTRLIRIDNTLKKPNICDAVKFADDPDYYTIGDSTALSVSDTEILAPNFNNEPADARNIRSIILDGKSKIQVDVIDFLNETYPSFDFDQFKCSRDVGLIIDAVVDDMMFSTNYKSVLAGVSYFRATASEVIDSQISETIAAVNFVKTAALALITVDSTQGPEYVRIEDNFDTIIAIMSDSAGAAPVLVFNPPTGVDANRANAKDILVDNRQFLIEEGIAYISEFYPSLVYDESKCRRDIAYIIDAVTYDILYSGNSQTADAADEYYSSGVLQVPAEEKQATIDTFVYIKSIADDCLLNNAVTAKNQTITQDVTNPAASSAEVTLLNDLFDIVINLIENGYTCTITLEEPLILTLTDDSEVSFHQFSLITSSGHTFEWIGSGTNVNSALPYLGGVPITENQVIEVNGGKVYYTGTDQRGDFRIGNDLVINRSTGTITGRTFNKSLFAVMTPYILAIGE